MEDFFTGKGGGIFGDPVAAEFDLDEMELSGWEGLEEGEDCSTADADPRCICNPAGALLRRLVDSLCCFMLSCL